ncbi:DNA cytosine methyltransferase [Alloscardovia omnicolens]|uniref:Cytosine-specific methyltransferase n=1 Tax=Alloscardovia omnicolens F0580 TaxID=1321816 RepID=U1QUT1_9BIFI|nr:DNA cytosine methyltransferase [Alloscardovia omnicolens]ERH31170.1 DNA (cytosine-5-)-methyltransferase [Alloscardovia omnicolens F0580]MDK6445019.1 DNA cytosine methyltransferase [Alloscardovia omnicolens]MDK8649941.1 DNA cytosine methyltransferase [Alloscardovia omnicolens]PKY78324.1 DNA cytosine methyltransferase [Alloscardovia omnicolens]
MYTVVDLFAGAGGLSLGFMQTGKFNIVAAAENNKNAQKTYHRNHPNTRLYSDVRDIDYKSMKSHLGKIDIVIGGPPCQGFSNANRQHSTIVSMNNRLVKEYVRAICELRPKAFVMENVAMLRSSVHRFLVEDEDIRNSSVMELEMKKEYIELIPSSAYFPGALDFIKTLNTPTTFMWNDRLFRLINHLFRYRINQTKFNQTLEKHKRGLLKYLDELMQSSKDIARTTLKTFDNEMVHAIVTYSNNREQSSFAKLILSIEKPLMLQRAIHKMQEILSNNIHIYEYKMLDNKVVALVKSYAVLDYITGILGNAPYSYNLTQNTFNAIDYGAPQRRERFVLVGISNSFKAQYPAPQPTVDSKEYPTVRDAISDLQDVPVSTDVKSNPISLEDRDDLSDLAKQLRGNMLYNHVCTASRSVAIERFKSLHEGQNFHDLDDSLKSTYSNSKRTQNTIYLRLKYDEPSRTVVNVRKSMWIHPKLNRAISIREAARLQTFPDNFVFEGTKDSQYQQVGNAVPPCLANAVAKSLLSLLDEE